MTVRFSHECPYLGAAKDDEAVRAGVVREVARHHAPRVLLLVDHARDREGTEEREGGKGMVRTGPSVRARMESAVDYGHGIKGIEVPDDGVGFARDRGLVRG